MMSFVKIGLLTVLLIFLDMQSGDGEFHEREIMTWIFFIYFRIHALMYILLYILFVDKKVRDHN